MIRTTRAQATILTLAVLLLGVASVAAETVVPPRFSQGEPATRSVEIPPMRLAAMAAAEPVATLRPAAEGAADQLDALLAWNRERRTPARSGFSRPLPMAHTVSLDDSLGRGGLTTQRAGVAARPLSGDLVYGLRIQVRGAHRLRLHLETVNLPPVARLWVYGDESPDDVTPFGLELLGPDGDLWTPSVGGEWINLEVVVPSELLAGEKTFGFQVTDVTEIFFLGSDGQPLQGRDELVARETSCFVDGMCITSSTFANIALLREAIGNYGFISGGFSYGCTGGLVADQPGSLTPYFLTAEHCVGSQAEATTVEAYFSDYTDFCNGPPKPFSQLPRVNGATLLASGALPSQSDFSLLRLLATPSGSRTYLGWDVTLPVKRAGSDLFRLSHPVISGISMAQTWAKHQVDQTGTPFCTDVPRSLFLYSWDLEGGTGPGSSGSPAVDSGLHVRGQLLGACGQDPNNECDRTNATVDGFFGATYPYVKQWLDPGTTPTGCTESSTTHCLNDDRFQVRATWRDYAGQTGSAQAVPLTGDSGLFYFFSYENIEFLVKVLDGCSFNNNYWVFAAATTDVAYTLTVVDTQAGQTRTYTNPLGTASPAITDTGAFATCP